ncbi:hypothetical protein Hanom_Chr01g00061311 [Helianthus anomalus]
MKQYQIQIHNGGRYRGGGFQCDGDGGRYGGGGVQCDGDGGRYGGETAVIANSDGGIPAMSKRQ